jgi:hypothetical protein
MVHYTDDNVNRIWKRVLMKWRSQNKVEALLMTDVC